MAGSASVEVRFDGAQGLMVGQPGDYVARPGFWQGGAGIAACWYGGAMGIARALLASTRGTRVEDPHRLAHLGAIDAALCAASATLRATAAWIDAHPRADAFIEASRARLVVETLAGQVLHHATRAMGAGPLCQDASVARAVADLPVYIRQSHAERDQAALARRLVETPVSKENAAWML